jgi:dTDP-4-dehydrorhamnose reductase
MILVSGAGGRLGSWLVKNYPEFSAWGVDITNEESVKGSLARFKPQVVINCACFCEVDAAETQFEEAYKVNASGVGNLRRSFDGYLIQISTGHVFSGEVGNYKETDRPSPANAYGWTKWAGEIQAKLAEPTLIIRTMDLFGPHGDDLVGGIRAGRVKELPTGYWHQATYIPFLAKAIQHAMTVGLTGIVNYAGRDTLSKAQFGQTVGEFFGVPVPEWAQKDWGSAAKRPVLPTLDLHLAEQVGMEPQYLSEALNDLKSRTDTST